MTSTAPLAYPAEYYYPEFIDSRIDDPRISVPTRFPLKTSVDNGIGSSTQIPASFQHVDELDVSKKPSNKKQGLTTLRLDVATNQGLPDTDITQAVRTDPKKNLLRDPVERNIPRLIVDDSLFSKNMLTAGLGDNPLPLAEPVETKPGKKPGDGRKSVSNGHINGGPRSKSKMSHAAMSVPVMRQQSLAFIEEEPPIDNYWQKEVHIDEEGGVSIERLNYDRSAYNGPFGMTRQGSTIFYVSMGILSLLGAVFLIMTGVFYSKSFPDSSSNTAKLAGMGICGLVFYVCLQLILIGLWHQKYREENPKGPPKTIDPHDESKARLKSSMENNAQYDYSHPEQMDYTPYGGYPTTPYNSNVNEQMLLQQPGAATGAAFYDPVVWPSNVEIETQPDSRFFQPMEAVYGQPAGFARTTQATPHYVPLATVTDSRPKKKSHRDDTSKTISAEQPQANFDDIFPNSTVADTNMPVLKNAPETNELLRTIEEMERNQVRTSDRRTSTVKTSNRVNPVDGRTEISSRDTPNTRSHRDQRPRHRRHHNRHHRRSSFSPCSTCSDRSRNDFHSDVAIDARPRHEYKSKMLGARPSRAHTLSPTTGARSKLRSTGTGTDIDSGYTVGIEDAPNVRDDRDEQIPVVRRTIIVEPYPATPNTQILLKPNTAQGGKGLSVETMDINGDNDQDIYQSTDALSKKSKKKKRTVAGRDQARRGDLRLEDVNDDDPKYYPTDGGSRKKRTTTNQRPAQQTTSSHYQ